jgi:8-oxo-dGTP pyrophosphatase MutT (NUDIX family)
VAEEQRNVETAKWTIHDERLIDDTHRLNLSIASVELPDGVKFEQYVLRMPKASMVVVLDDARENVLMIWRNRFVMDRWTWELPGGYVDPHEDPAVTAAREVEEETGWRPRSLRKIANFQPVTGTADFENIVFASAGAVQTDTKPDINEAARVEWISLKFIPDLIRQGEIIGAGAQIGLLSVLLEAQLRT